MKRIIDIIKSNMDEFDVSVDELRYKTLQNKRYELISLGQKIVEKRDVIEEIYSSQQFEKKYSAFTTATWGLLSPSIYSRYTVTNRKHIKRFYINPLKNRTHLEYGFCNGKIAYICSVNGMKRFDDRYLFCVDNRIYSFMFSKYRDIELIDVKEAIYNKNDKVISVSRLSTRSLNIKPDPSLPRYMHTALSGSLLDMEYYTYDSDGKLLYADNFTRIYNFSKQILGIKLGDRIVFKHNQEGDVIGYEWDYEAVPCVFDEE